MGVNVRSKRSSVHFTADIPVAGAFRPLKGQACVGALKSIFQRLVTCIIGVSIISGIQLTISASAVGHVKQLVSCVGLTINRIINGNGRCKGRDVEAEGEGKGDAHGQESFGQFHARFSFLSIGFVCGGCVPAQ